MSLYIKNAEGEIVGGGVNTAMLPGGAPPPPRPPRPSAGARPPMSAPPPPQGGCEARVRQLEAELAALRGQAEFPVRMDPRPKLTPPSADDIRRLIQERRAAEGGSV